MTGGILHVGIEMGGTKVVIGGSTSGADLVGRHSIPTREPASTFADVRSAVDSLAHGYELAGIGIASFGPIDLRIGRSTYGRMLPTPKAGWTDADVFGGIGGSSRIPVALDTDVNAATLGERVWGAGTTDSFAYLTVGTGIGGGIWSNGSVLHGANHPEIGHIRIPRHLDDTFQGSCPFHGDCLEGMASGTAMRNRWGVTAQELGSHVEQALAYEAWYLAHGIAGLCAVIPVEQVIIGGGVAKLEGLHTAVSDALPGASGVYPAVPFADGGPEILPPGLGDDAGVVGAIELARQLSTDTRRQMPDASSQL